MAIFDWFKQPASNTMLQNTFGNQFFQDQVRPVQTGASNVRPTNLAALKNWRPWNAFMPQSMGGTFYTKPTAAASRFIGSNIASGLPFAYAYGANKLQESLPQSLTGEGGLADQNPYYGAMGVAVDPVVEETLRYGDKIVPSKVYPESAYRSETEKFRTRFNPTQIEAAPEKTGIFSNFKDRLSNFNFPSIVGLAKRAIEPNTPEENFGLGYFNRDPQTGRTYGNPADDVFAGKNVVSAWGEGMGAAAQKRIDKINETLSKWESDEEKYARQLANTTLYDRRKKFQRQLAEYNKDLAADKAAAEAASKKQWQAAYSNWQSPSGRDHAGTAGIGSRESRAGGAPGTSRGEASWKGYLGGRAGYREGELVEQDVNIQGPDFDINEQMAGYIDPMDALNDMSMDIFGKPLNLLNEEEYQMLIDMANDQAMAEQPEGLASLV